MWFYDDNSLPFYELRSLHRAVNNFLNSPLDRMVSRGFPPANIYGNEDEIAILIEATGLKKDDIDITLEDRVITIKCAREDNFKDKEDEVVIYRKERENGEFIRSFELPYEVEEGKIKAKYHAGVLEIILPRAESDKPRKINVE